MKEVRAEERFFFGVICVAALFVTFLGFFAPARMDQSFTWVELPPLHARFVGVLYLFGGIFMLGCVFARYRSQVTPALPAIGFFTGLLLIATLLNLDAFDFDLGPVWVWTLSYIVYPIIAFTLAWRSRRRETAAASGPPLPKWARTFFEAQAAVFGIVGLILLGAPSVMVDAWPWPISSELAQFYAGPVLAYAFCSWRYGTRHSWLEVATVVPAMLAFTAGTIVVSLVHSELFSASGLGDWVWFAGFGVATAFLAVMSGRLLALTLAR